MSEIEKKPLEEEIVEAEMFPSEKIQQEPVLEVPAPVKAESKLTKSMRQIGIWVLAFLGFGLLIFLLTYFLMVRPAVLSNKALTENNAAMETQLGEYRDDIDAKTTALADAESHISEMDSTIMLYEEYSAYNKLLNNLAQMQKAVIVSDPVSTRVALANAQKNLDKLVVLLENYDASLSELLQERLTYLATTDGDADEVYQEIETMYVYLLELQETLFGTLY